MMTVILFVILGIILILGVIGGIISFHKYCKEKYGFSPFRIGSMISLLFMNCIWLVTVSFYMIQSLSDNTITFGNDTFAIGAIIVICISIFIINLKTNIKHMGALMGTIGTIIATVISGFFIFTLINLMPTKKR